MHPLAAPGTLWVLSSDGKYLVRPQAGETSHKKQISCGRQGKRAPLLFSVSQRVSPLRRRPKGFPVALWKPSGPLAAKGRREEQLFCGRQGKGPSLLEGFASAEATKGLSDRPLETFGSHLLKRRGTTRNKFLVEGKGKEPFSLFSVSQELSPLRRRPGRLSDRPLDPFGEFLSQTEPYPSAVFMHIGQKIPKQQTNLPCPISCITLIKI